MRPNSFVLPFLVIVGGATTVELPNRILWKIDDGSAASDRFSPLATWGDGHFFIVYVALTGRPRVVHLTVDADWEVQAEAIFLPCGSELMLFSIGVDEEGHVHVAGGVDVPIDEPRYQQRCPMWRTTRPLCISSLTFSGGKASACPRPGGFKWLRFLNDKEGYLYAVHWGITGSRRSPAREFRALAVNAFHAPTGTWFPVGDRHPDWGGDPCLLATPLVRGGGEDLDADVHFHASGKMHVAAVLPLQGRNASSVVYAVRDGQAFRRQDGTTIALPMTVGSGTQHDADVVYEGGPGVVLYPRTTVTQISAAPVVLVGQEGRWAAWTARGVWEATGTQCGRTGPNALFLSGEAVSYLTTNGKDLFAFDLEGRAQKVTTPWKRLQLDRQYFARTGRLAGLSAHPDGGHALALVVAGQGVPGGPKSGRMLQFRATPRPRAGSSTQPATTTTRKTTTTATTTTTRTRTTTTTATTTKTRTTTTTATTTKTTTTTTTATTTTRTRTTTATTTTTTTTATTTRTRTTTTTATTTTTRTTTKTTTTKTNLPSTGVDPHETTRLHEAALPGQTEDETPIIPTVVIVVSSAAGLALAGGTGVGLYMWLKRPPAPPPEPQIYTLRTAAGCLAANPASLESPSVRPRESTSGDLDSWLQGMY